MKSHGLSELPGEIPLQLLADKGRVSLMTMVYGDSDTLEIVGRIFDAANGTMVDSMVIQSAKLDSRLPTDFRSYYTAVSPNRSRIISEYSLYKISIDE